jgi:hypothetical protein
MKFNLLILTLDSTHKSSNRPIHSSLQCTQLSTTKHGPLTIPKPVTPVWGGGNQMMTRHCDFSSKKTSTGYEKCLLVFSTEILPEVGFPLFWSTDAEKNKGKQKMRLLKYKNFNSISRPLKTSQWPNIWFFPRREFLSKQDRNTFLGFSFQIAKFLTLIRHTSLYNNIDYCMPHFPLTWISSFCKVSKPDAVFLLQLERGEEIF